LKRGSYHQVITFILYSYFITCKKQQINESVSIKSDNTNNRSKMATDNKYDRQLRLWGANGQKALSESCVVLINATAVGTETLKNLVLPGIGSFHIIDDHQVSHASAIAGTASNSSSSEPFSNFFVFSKSGESSRSRAEVATKHLSELNPDVQGKCTPVESLQTADYPTILKSIASSSSSQAAPNILVIAADLPPQILRTISSLCWDGLDSNSSPIPLVIVKSYGLVGSVRVQTPYHPIIESKPDNTKPDLRLAFANRDFPQLYQLASKTDLKALDSQQHSHVPYVILLLQALDHWRSKQSPTQSQSDVNDNVGKKLPKTFEQKNEFKQMVKSMARGNWGHELNFVEADENAYLAYTTLEIPWEVEGLLDSVQYTIENKATQAAGQSSDSISSFDVLLLALKRFMKDHGGFPPLDGSIPDMTASTQGYIELQGVYKSKAESDKGEMRSIISDIAKEFEGRITIPTISDEELATFCKNIFHLRLTKTRSFVNEYDFVYKNDEEKEEILGELASLTFDPYEVPEHTPLLWHIALRACDAFYDENGHYPGQDSRELALERDAEAVQKHIVDIVAKLGLEENDLIRSTLLSTEDDKKLAFAKEMTRYQNAEIHNVASVVGGVASQEAVKLITGQYVPMDGNYLFNGIVGVAGVCNL
jgi:amyloid beta precursor protein binding protein 1